MAVEALAVEEAVSAADEAVEDLEIEEVDVEASATDGAAVAVEVADSVDEVAAVDLAVDVVETEGASEAAVAASEATGGVLVVTIRDPRTRSSSSMIKHFISRCTSV